MKKIAVCIPSYNECQNIGNITKKIDKGLYKYKKMGFDVIIVNCDNNSPDNTSYIFKTTTTKCSKLSILSDKKGKGSNLLNFFKYCKDNNIDYAITIDADVKSMKPKWISKFLKPLILCGCDYVTPIYKRSRYEGSTTNHFAFPIIYATTGCFVRQPIAGDFSFNKKFINLILDYPVCSTILQYGIDIFMTFVACYNNLKISQIRLSKKIHNPSYNKMENMFVEVLESFLFVWGNQHLKQNYQFSNSKNFKNNYNSILVNDEFKHKGKTYEMQKKYLEKLDVDNFNFDIETLWIEKLCEIVLEPKLITSKEKQQILSVFIVRATKFWIESEKISARKCEYIINNQLIKLMKAIDENKRYKEL